MHDAWHIRVRSGVFLTTGHADTMADTDAPCHYAADRSRPLHAISVVYSCGLDRDVSHHTLTHVPRTVQVMSQRTMTELKRLAPAPASRGRSSETSRGSPTTCVTKMLRRFTQPSRNSARASLFGWRLDMLPAGVAQEFAAVQELYDAVGATFRSEAGLICSRCKQRLNLIRGREQACQLPQGHNQG